METHKMLPLIRDVRNLIYDENDWIKRWYASDSEGNDCDPVYDDAVKFCLVGAIHHVCHGKYHEATFDVTSHIQNKLDDFSIATFNDHPETTHDEVIDLLSDIIQEMEENDG